MRNRKLQMLCEGAILVALAQILSMLKLWEMPWGGSITLGMLPIFLFAVRWGTRWGLVAGFAYGLLQVMFDGGFPQLESLGDYLVAFTVLGLAGLGRGKVSWGRSWAARFVSTGWWAPRSGPYMPDME
ncbi:MAG: energy-coupled thiamine transporter ThiT [Evtepia gabavorous]